MIVGNEPFDAVVPYNIAHVHDKNSTNHLDHATVAGTTTVYIVHHSNQFRSVTTLLEELNGVRQEDPDWKHTPLLLRFSHRIEGPATSCAAPGLHTCIPEK